MLSILELPTVRRQAVPIDIRTYHWMGEQGLVEKNTELIRGVIIEKMSKSPLHQYVIRLLVEAAEKAAGENHLARKEDPLTLIDSEPEPDVAIVQGSSKDFRHRHPSMAQLVIEVAVSSIELDREKAFLYAEANIPEYWLVIPEKQTVEIFTQPENGIYARHRVCNAGETITAAEFPNLTVNLAELFG